MSAAEAVLPRYPLVVGHWSRTSTEILIHATEVQGTVRIDGDEAELLALDRVLAQCTGFRDATELQAEAGTREVLARLAGLGVVVNGRCRPRTLLGELRKGVNCSAAAVAEIQAEPLWRDPRARPDSVRIRAAPPRGLSGPLRQHSLALDASCPTRRPTSSELAALASLVYGTDGRWKPVPSAGRLWPLQLHLLCPGASGYAVHWFDANTLELADVSALIDLTVVGDIFWQPELRRSCAAGELAIMVMSADLSRSERKYGNRAAMFALMEAGAAMHQLGLAGAAHRLATRPIAGFEFEPVRTLVGNDLEPLILCVVQVRA